MSAAGQRKRGINFRCSLAKADNCRLDFSVSPAVLSLLVGRKAGLHKRLGDLLTIEWGELAAFEDYRQLSKNCHNVLIFK